MTIKILHILDQWMVHSEQRFLYSTCRQVDSIWSVLTYISAFTSFLAQFTTRSTNHSATHASHPYTYFATHTSHSIFLFDFCMSNSFQVSWLLTLHLQKTKFSFFSTQTYIPPLIPLISPFIPQCLTSQLIVMTSCFIGSLQKRRGNTSPSLNHQIQYEVFVTAS